MKKVETGLLHDLYSRPGFMLRRAHQIAVDLFVQACLPLNLTPSQYGVLFITNSVGAISQMGLSRLIGLDRSTTALVIRNLTERELLTRTRSLVDYRKVEVELTSSGRAVFAEAKQLADNEMNALLAPFTDDERAQFMTLFSKFLDYHNERTRVSISSN